MKILIVTDAWYPQINGVVHTLDHVGQELVKMGHTVEYLTHEGFKTFPLPSYPEIRMVWDWWNVRKKLSESGFDAIHIATEGTLGSIARNYCVRNNIAFTTSYHTKLPEYIKERYPFIPLKWSYKFMKWLHSDSHAVLLTTQSMKEELEVHDFHQNMIVWTRGTDLELFHPNKGTVQEEPILLYVGRVSIEKNLEAFLTMDPEQTLGKKVIVGDGPVRKQLEKEFPDALFVGAKKGEELAQWFADADVFVFPSKSDTFGIVMIEANACGTPIAAYPVTGPKDFVVNGVNGYLDDDLEQTVLDALTVDRQMCRDYVARRYTWKRTAEIFLKHLVKR